MREIQKTSKVVPNRALGAGNSLRKQSYKRLLRVAILNLENVAS